MRNPNTNKVGQCKYPIHHLSPGEINEPVQVIQDFFSFAHLPEVREMLWLSFKTNVTGAFPQGDALTPIERHYIVALFEQLIRLVEAAHLINEQIKSSNTTK